MTTDLFASFRAFCEEEGLAAGVIGDRFRTDRRGRELLIGLETGALPEADFEQRCAEILGVSPDRLIERMFAGGGPDDVMQEAVRRARAARIRVEPEACVFVDDLTFNLAPARELGMAAVHHVDPQHTIGELQRLLAVDLT
ncbi:MAG: hypothetical protein ACJ780_09365 [Solirubrobacteraceae bacterium]